MKNQIIKQLYDATAAELEGIHIILDKVIDAIAAELASVENGPQIMYSPREDVFVVDLDDGARILISRDFAQFGVVVSVISNDVKLAECRLDTGNRYNESAGRIPTALKERVRKLFDAISVINSAVDEPVPEESETPAVEPSEVDVIEPQA